MKYRVSLEVGDSIPLDRLSERIERGLSDVGILHKNLQIDPIEEKFRTFDEPAVNETYRKIADGRAEDFAKQPNWTVVE